MPSAETFSPSAAMPIAMTKPNYYDNSHHAGYERMSVSPPEAPESVTTSGGLSYSAHTSSYAGSSSEYDMSGSCASVDLLEYMGDRVQGSFDPLPLDRSLAKQSQTSGELNNKSQELRKLRALAQSRLAAARVDFAQGMKAAKEVQRDLQWTQKRVNALNEKAARRFPAEYELASQKFPAPVDY